jgi:energy-coupling factor transport system permease protein
MRIHDITIGQYAERDSAVHSLDPRTKLLICGIVMILTLLLSRLDVAVSLFIILILFHCLARLNPLAALKNLRPFLWLFLVTWGLHIFLSEGKVLYRIPVIGVLITEEGIRDGFFYSLRIALLIITANLLTLTTSPMALTDAMERLLSPLKRIGVPAHEIAMMLSIAIRFIPLLVNESERIRKAQISRGNRFEGSLIRKMKQMIPLIIPLFLSAFRRANDLALAMDARCYRGGVERTSFVQLRFKFRDAAALCLVLILGVPVILLH